MRIKKQIIVWAGVIAWLGMSAGCRTAVNTTENAEKTGVTEVIQDARVVTDLTLESRVNILAVNVAEAPTGVMRVQLEVANLRNSVQTVFYSVEWFDGSGMRVSTASGGWRQQQFMPRETLFITLAAPGPQVKDFRVKLMENPR